MNTTTSTTSTTQKAYAVTWEGAFNVKFSIESDSLLTLMLSFSFQAQLMDEDTRADVLGQLQELVASEPKQAYANAAAKSLAKIKQRLAQELPA